MTTIRSCTLLLMLIPLCLLLGVTCGCDDSAEQLRESKRRMDRKQRQAGTDVDHLSEAMTYLSRIVNLDQAAAARQINYHLNAWYTSAGAGKGDDWKLSAMGEKLTSEYPQEMALASPQSTMFLPADLEHLRSSYMLSRVARWVGDGQLHDQLLADWLADPNTVLTDDQVTQLELALRFFDWTVRNIRLEPLHFPPEARRVAPNNMPAGLQFDAPGYRQTLDQMLWRGMGDGIQRARVFLALCQQARVHACMLYLGNETTSQIGDVSDDSGVWVAGVLAGEQIFLLDLTLGIAIPGPDQKGVATLREAIENESVLRRMNVTGLYDYPVSGEQLKSVSALLDYRPEAYCQRMAVLEKSLAGENRMRLSVDSSSAESFEKHPLIHAVNPWAMGILARRYDDAIQHAAIDDYKVLFDQQSRWAMFTPGTESLSQAIVPIAAARWQHLLGNFDRREDNPGARVMYLDQRRSDAMIERLPYNLDVQADLKLYRPLKQSVKQFDQFLQLVQMQLRQSKQASTFWQALIQFEESQYEGAVAWNQTRILDREIVSPWSAAARYNLGRSLEHLDRIDEAIKFYKTEGDPQEHGNRIRARLLSRQ